MLRKTNASQVSWHFRGPLHLKQFAFYTPGSSTTKRGLRPTPHERRYGKDLAGRQHQHGNAHKRKHLDANYEIVPIIKRDPQQYVTAVINGQTVSWPAPTSTPDVSSPTTSVGAEQWITATIDGKVVSWANPAAATSVAPSPSSTEDSDARIASTSSASSAAPSATINPGTGNWGRQAYYNAGTGQKDGLVFLNNHGGQGSGTFD